MKIRRSFWTDRPLNVSRREYERYHFQAFLTVIFGMVSIGCLISVLFNLTDVLSQDLERFPSLSVSEALKGRPEDQLTYKFEGKLVSDRPLGMPDDPNQKVLAGMIDLQIRPTGQTKEPKPTSLFFWEQSANPISLEQKGDRIPVGFETSSLPLEIDRQVQVRYVREGEGRLSKKVAVEYGGKTYPIPDEYLKLNGRFVVKVNRQYVPHNKAVVVLARVATNDTGRQLSAPLNRPAQVYAGTEEGIKVSGQQARPILGLVGILFGGAFYWSLRRSLKLREAIALKSNLPKS